MFYWLFKSRGNPDTDPLVLWLTGGPGCASEVALFYENGPYTINPDLSLKSNPFSWNNVSNLLFVDQPIGTGFSKSASIFDLDTNED
jgi:cathepsin A (carboxypeptidase C)